MSASECTVATDPWPWTMWTPSSSIAGPSTCVRNATSQTAGSKAACGQVMVVLSPYGKCTMPSELPHGRSGPPPVQIAWIPSSAKPDAMASRIFCPSTDSSR